jgi:hypothetical protein
MSPSPRALGGKGKPSNLPVIRVGYFSQIQDQDVDDANADKIGKYQETPMRATDRRCPDLEDALVDWKDGLLQEPGAVDSA